MALDVIITQFVTKGEGALRGTLRTLATDVDTFEGKLARLEATSTAMIVGGAGLAGALGKVGVASLKAHGDIQLAEIGLSKTLGGMEAAKKKIEELRQFDRQSPFSFQESVKGTMRLAAVGFEAQELKQVLTDIGDAAAGTGGTTEDFMGIGRAIGQMRSKGRISMEEINQLGDRGIPALQILQKQLKLTDEQISDLMQGTYVIKSDVGVDALLRGFRELYGGSMLEASKTFPGQVQNLSSAVFQLGDALGEVLASDGSGLIADLTELTDSTREFVKNNPELVKTALYIAGIGAGLTVVGGVTLKTIGIWKEMNGLFKGTIATIKSVTAAKSALTMATRADDDAEKAKAVTALAEGKAIAGVGKASEYSATAAMRLAGKEAEAAMAAERAAARAAKAAAKRKAIMDGLTPLQRIGVGLQRSAAGKWLGGSAFTVPGRSFGAAGELVPQAVTRGGALLRGGAGLAAGHEVQDNMKALGYGAGESMAAATVTGLAAAFVPGAQIPALIASAISFGINKAYNEPMERAAEAGNGLDDKTVAVLSGMSRQQQAEVYNQQAAKLREEGDELGAQNAMQMALRLKRLDRKSNVVGTEQWREEQARRVEALSNDPWTSIGRQRAERAAGRGAAGISNRPVETTRHRNGSDTVTFRIPEREADRSARRLTYNTLTAAPAF